MTILRRGTPGSAPAAPAAKRRRTPLIVAGAAVVLAVIAGTAFAVRQARAPHPGPSAAAARSVALGRSSASPSPSGARSPAPHTTLPKHAASQPGTTVTAPAQGAPAPPPAQPNPVTITAAPPKPAPTPTHKSEPWKSCAYYSGTALTEYGDTGDRVVEVQCILKARGYNLGSHGVDGNFGADTRSAVKSFQSAHHLTVDGQVGVHTWSALRA